MSHGPSPALLDDPPEPEPADEPPPLPALLPPLLEPPVPLPPTFPLPPAPGAPPEPVWSSMVPDVVYSVLWGVTVTLPPAAKYEYGVSAIATAKVNVFPSVL